MGYQFLAKIPTASKVVIQNLETWLQQKIFDDSVKIFLIADASDIPTVNHLRIIQIQIIMNYKLRLEETTWYEPLAISTVTSPRKLTAKNNLKDGWVFLIGISFSKVFPTLCQKPSWSQVQNVCFFLVEKKKTPSGRVQD